MTRFYINETLLDEITVQDLLNMHHGTLGAVFSKVAPDDEIFFDIEDKDFKFKAAWEGNEVYFVRNSDKATIKLVEDYSLGDSFALMISWSFDGIALALMYKNGNIYRETAKTIPTVPPKSTIDYVKKHNLIPITTYRNFSEFKNRVYSSLSSIAEIIESVDSASAFWDFTYDGKKIIKRSPKKEPSVLSSFHMLLHDKMYISNIEVIPEYKTGVGNVDFMLIGTLDNGEKCELCIEVKLAHSDDILNGYQNQLLEYMQHKNIQCGVYCVFWFKGEWYDKPELEREELLLKLNEIKKQSKNPYLRATRIYVFDASKKTTASKLGNKS